MTTKPTALPVNFDGIPHDLKSIARWVLWKYVPVKRPDGEIKWKKMPCDLDGKPAKTDEPSTWSTYDRVVDEFMLRDYDGIGVVIDGSGDFQGIDIDDCVANGQLNDTAQELLDNVDGYAETSPSGNGIKLFTRSNLAISGKKGDIEVYKDGRYFTVTGHRLNGHDALPTVTQDVGWFVERHFGQNQGADLGDGGALALYKPPLADWDLDRVRDELMPYVNDVDSYEGWLKVGMALHHQGQGDSAWMELWDEASRQSEHYDRDELEAKWDSFNQQRDRGQGALTLASIIKQVGESRAGERKERFEELKQQIDSATDAESLRSVTCAEIQKDSAIDKFHRDVLAQLLKSKFRALGMPAGLNEVKKLIKPRSMNGLPDWLEDWVYVTHEDVFFNVVTKRKVRVSGFNAMYNREVGGMDTETSASAIALDLYRIPTPDKIIYLPWAPEHFDLNGTPCVNGYDPNSPPDIPATFSKGDLEAIETVKAHLGLILTEVNAPEIMLAWMAHNVQKPGVKIRWAPLVKGIEGDGKTVLGKVLRYAMGHINVGMVSPTVLADKYTAWADGRCVNVLEEIRMVGHNRYDTLNALKPYITNDEVTVHPKGVNEYMAPNTVNYIAFTNHQDALPLEETDRRWWVQFSPFSSQDELRNVADSLYFTRLHNAIEQHAGALRRWLLEWPIPAWFEPNGQAPASAAKAKMVGLNVSDDELIVREVIAQGGCGVHKDIVSTSHLSTALSLIEGIEVPRTTALSRTLMKLGFSKVTKQLKWRSQPVRVWVRGNKWDRLSEAEFNALARSLLDSTLQDDILS